MLPHAVGAVGYIPTILHPAGHGHSEMKTDMIVQSPVVLRGIRA